MFGCCPQVPSSGPLQKCTMCFFASLLAPIIHIFLPPCIKLMPLSHYTPLVNRNIANNRYAVSVRWEREMEEERASGRKKPLCTGTARDLDAWFCCCAQQIGGMFALVEQTDGTPIVIAGPCWPFCTFITVPLIVVLSGLVSYFVVLNRDSGLVS